MSDIADIEAVLADRAASEGMNVPEWWLQSLASVLAPVLAAAVREAKVEALREAAKAALRKGGGRPEYVVERAWWSGWLRDRADRVAVDAPECGAATRPRIDYNEGGVPDATREVLRDLDPALIAAERRAFAIRLSAALDPKEPQ